MSLPFFGWPEDKPIEDLDELRRNVRERGGSIRSYDRILSGVVFMLRTSELEWVPADVSPMRAGLKHAAYCAVLGWWSILGWMFTPAFIINNLRGGVDVTELLIEDDPAPEVLAAAAEQVERREKSRQLVIVATLFIILGVTAAFTFRACR